MTGGIALRSQKIYFSKENFENENFSAAAAVSSILRIPARIRQEVFESFKGLPHRMEFVMNFDGVDFINDSKSTTVESTLWAINQIKKPVILICGGKDKGLRYEGLSPYIGKNVRFVFIIGSAKDKIYAALPGGAKKKRCGSLDEALMAAKKAACPGDAVLFSCMCSSYDMFKNYKERGNVFKRLVSEFM